MADEINKNSLGQNAAIDIAIDAAMGVTDPGVYLTDIMLDQLIDTLVNHYATASSEVQAKCNNYFSKFEKKDSAKLADLNSGKITKSEYQQWRSGQLLMGKQWQELSETLAKDLTNANQIAADIINGHKSSAYALNHNYGTYEIEKNLGIDTSYVLYDKNTVERLVAKNPNILPKTKVNIPKDLAWNKKKINSAIVQGVLQGESIPNISKRLQSVTDMNKNSAIRNARTAMTGAQNGGRMDSYQRARDMGIGMKKIWLSTVDGRTRHSHRLLMGEAVDIDKAFSNGLKFPGDPDGAGSELYNCRCTLICQVKGIDFNIQDRISQILNEKGMTWDDWIAERPLSKKTGETKAQYLKRYSEYKKKQSFKSWLIDEAAPDAMVQSVWGNKGWSKVFYEIYDKDHAAANSFKKELTALGKANNIKPKDIWDQYLTGQLDAEDLNKFEGILKKYLPDSASSVTKADDISDAAKTLKKTEQADNISDAAKAAEGNLKITKGDPMSMTEADDHKVNPFHNKNDATTTKNCQTSAYAYECRRQGYDVVALPKDPKIDDIYSVQTKLGSDQTLGWINKETGKNPEKLLSDHWKDSSFVAKSDDMISDLEKTIGKNGERYTLSYRWSNGKKTGAHVVNIDRDENGLLRIIDNQRGPGEKHIWVGKDAEKYISDMQSIRYVTRVDDCVPNPEYFNKIVVDSKKVKPNMPSKMSDLDKSKYAKMNQYVKNNDKITDATADYYKKWKYGIVDDDKLDEIFETTKKVDKATDTTKLSKNADDLLDKFKADNLSDNWHVLATKYSDIYDDVWDEVWAGKSITNENVKSYWKKYVTGEIKNSKLDDILLPYANMTYPNGVSKVAKVADDVLDKSNIPNKLYVSKMGEDTFDDIFDLLENKGIYEKHKYYKDWYNGKIKDSDLDDYWKKHASKAADNITDDLDAFKKNLPENMFSLDSKQFNEVTAITENKYKGKYKFKSDYWKAYVKGEVDDPDLDNLFKPKVAAKTTPKPTPAPTVSKLDFDAIKDKKMSAVYNEIKATDTKTANKFYNELKKMGKPSEVWDDYVNGAISAENQKKIEDLLIKKYNNGKTTVTQVADKSDDLIKAEEKLKKAQDELNKITNKTYSGIWKDDVTLADYESKKSTIKAKKIYYEDEIDKLKNDPSYKSGFYSDTEKQIKIKEYEKYLDDLDEFETLGKEYAKAQKAIRDAQQEVLKNTPVGEAYTQARKDAARWAKTESEYKKLDAIYDKDARPLQKTRTAREKEGYDHYTWGSRPFNSPLAGYDDAYFSKFVGINKVDINTTGYGDRIRGLTTYIEKSKQPVDFWIQSGQTTDTLDGMFGFSKGTINSMSDSELKSLIGQERELPQFISGSINRGGGTYVPGDTIFNIYCPQGSEALYVLEDGHFGKAEREMILQRGGTYKITNIYYGTVNGTKRLVVDMELRLEKGYHKFQQ